MSHYVVAVLTDGTKTVEELLAPYQEYGCEPMYDERYLTFTAVDDEFRDEYEKDELTFVYKDGNLYNRYDDVFLVRNEDGTGKHVVPDGLHRVHVPLKSIWPTYEQYLVEWYGYVVDADTGKVGYLENPDSRWDWWVEGGRWTGWAMERIGGTSMRVGDIKLDRDSLREKAGRWYDSTAKGSLEYELSTLGMSREQYVEMESHLSFWAVVTPDGVWHEHDTMGWWGMSSATKDGVYDWATHFEERFLANPDLKLTVVDCHI